MKIYKIHYWQNEIYYHEFTIAAFTKKQFVFTNGIKLNISGTENIHKYPNDSCCAYFLDRKSLKKYENLLKNLRHHSTISQNLKKHI